jgi:hypothetical protein
VSIGQLAEHVELSVEEVLDALAIASAHHSTSLQAARTDRDGDPVTLADLLGECDERFERVEASVTIGPAIGQLSDRDRKILALRFEHDLSLSQIAGLIGVSRCRSRSFCGAVSTTFEQSPRAISRSSTLARGFLVRDLAAVTPPPAIADGMTG